MSAATIPVWMDEKGLEIARQYTGDAECQRRAGLQSAVVEAMQAAVSMVGIDELEQESRLMRARNERLQEELTRSGQENLAYDLTMTNQSKRIAELEVQLEAVGAGSAGAMNPAANDLQRVYEEFRIGAKARSIGTLMANIQNCMRRSDCLWRIEHKFFMVPVPAVEWDEESEPSEECLLNWGHDPGEYAEHFGKALEILAARGAAQPAPTVVGPVPQGWIAALEAAVAAIYFDDSSDFRNSLGSVVRHMAPELAGELLCNPKTAYDKAQAMLAAAPQPAGQPCAPKKPEYDPQAGLSLTGDPQAGQPLRIVKGERDGNWQEFDVNGHGGLLRLVARMQDDDADLQLGQLVERFLLSAAPQPQQIAVVEPTDRHLPKNVAELLIDYFLRDELGVKCAPSVTLENQGEGESESHIWAFWIEENDTTSYLGEDGRIQWLGTAWTPDAPQSQQIAETCPVAPSIPGLQRDVVKLLITLATPSMYPRLLPLLEWVKNQPHQIAEPASQSLNSGLWYLQDTRQFVGNDVLWWAKDGNGYTTDVSKAHVYSKEEAFRQTAMRDTDRAWPKGYIDGKARPAVDFQDINHSAATKESS